MPEAPLPFLVAHRAGNDLRSLRRAERLGVRLVEADVHLFHRRLEVRHLKTIGPLPILWDRWALAPPWRPRPLLAALLEAAGPDTELMLDLKGRDPRLPALIAAQLRAHMPERAVTVCARHWPLLDGLRGFASVRLVPSIGARRQLDALRERFAGQRLDGVTIHRRLLDMATVADLSARADVVMTWPVATLPEMRLLGEWGVGGVISERFEELARGMAVAPG